MRQCECGSDKFYTCKCEESHGHHCAKCNKKIYIDWNTDYIIEEKETD